MTSLRCIGLLGSFTLLACADPAPKLSIVAGEARSALLAGSVRAQLTVRQDNDTVASSVSALGYEDGLAVATIPFQGVPSGKSTVFELELVWTRDDRVLLSASKEQVYESGATITLGETDITAEPDGDLDTHTDLKEVLKGSDPDSASNQPGAACTGSCAGTGTCCGGFCIDLVDNPLGCGACENVCDANEICGGTSCLIPECTTSTDCGETEFCDEGTCMPTGECRAGGQSCVTNSECCSAQCDNLSCVSCVALGQSCASALCCGGAVCDTTFQTCVPNAANAVCSDTYVSPGEDCDGANLAGATCVSVGHAAGEIACGDACEFDLSGCWTNVYTGATGSELRAVWAVPGSPQSVYAVGQTSGGAGYIAGGTQSPYSDTTIAAAQSLNAIFGTSGSDIWVVGAGPEAATAAQIFQSDGAGWTPVSSPPTGLTLNGGVVSNGTIFAVGAPTTGSTNLVTCTSDCISGTGVWTELSVASGVVLNAIAKDATDGYLAVGGLNGGAGTTVACTSNCGDAASWSTVASLPSALYSVVFADGKFWATGDDNSIYYCGNTACATNDWQEVRSLSGAAAITSIASTPAGRLVAVSSNTIYECLTSQDCTIFWDHWTTTNVATSSGLEVKGAFAYDGDVEHAAGAYVVGAGASGEIVRTVPE